MDQSSQRDISSDIASMLTAIGCRRRFNAGTYIVMEGTPAKSLFVLLKGSVCVLVEEESGDQTVMGHLFEGELFGEMSLCPGLLDRSAHVLARTDVEVLEVSRSRFLELAGGRSDLWLAIISQLSQRLIKITGRVRMLAQHNTARRLVYLLFELSELPDAETTPEGTLVNITRQELADMAGCKREVVSRSLQDIARAGLIELRGRQILVKPLPGNGVSAEPGLEDIHP